MRLNSASDTVEAFAIGWTRCRGEAHGVERYGDVVVASFPRFGLGSGRAREVLAYANHGDQIRDVARGEEARGEVWLAVFGQAWEDVVCLERLGYQVFRRDWLMSLPRLPAYCADDGVQLLSRDDLARLPDAQRQAVKPEFFDEVSFRLAAVFDGEMLAAWGRSASGEHDVVVIDSMVTQPAYRRQGLGRRVLTKLLGESARMGLGRSLLVATDDGRALYEPLGYAVAQSCFCMRRRRA